MGKNKGNNFNKQNNQNKTGPSQSKNDGGKKNNVQKQTPMTQNKSYQKWQENKAIKNFEEKKQKHQKPNNNNSQDNGAKRERSHSQNNQVETGILKKVKLAAEFEKSQIITGHSNVIVRLTDEEKKGLIIPSTVPGLNLFPQQYQEINTKQQNNKEEENSDSSDDENQEDEDLNQNAQQYLLKYLMYPVSQETFECNYEEKQPLVINRNNNNYYSPIELSKQNLIEMVQKNELEYNKDIILKNNTEQQIEELNREQLLKNLLTYSEDKTCVKLLKLQQLHQNIQQISSLLESYFSTLVYSSAQLTPANTEGDCQGYDDFDILILQISGSSNWKLNKSVKKEDQLPVQSSERPIDKSQVGKLITEASLQQGDLIYIPRGIIYEFKTTGSESLTLRFSFNQGNQWIQVLQKTMPHLMQSACESLFNIRKNLPKGYLSFMGVQASESNQKGQDNEFNSSDEDNMDEEDDSDEGKGTKISKQVGINVQKRKFFVQQCKEFLIKSIQDSEVLEDAIDNAIDEMGIEFLQKRLPPIENVSKFKSESQELNIPEMDDFWEDLEIRLVQKDVGRLISQISDENQDLPIDEQGENEEEQQPLEDIVLHHCGQNKQRQGNSEPLIFPIEAAPALEQLFNNYPYYMAIKDLELDEDEDKIIIVKSLYEKGLIVWRKMKELN